jgi:hypothetical protein
MEEVTREPTVCGQVVLMYKYLSRNSIRSLNMKIRHKYEVLPISCPLNPQLQSRICDKILVILHRIFLMQSSGT